MLPCQGLGDRSPIPHYHDSGTGPPSWINSVSIASVAANYLQFTALWPKHQGQNVVSYSWVSSAYCCQPSPNLWWMLNSIRERIAHQGNHIPKDNVVVSSSPGPPFILYHGKRMPAIAILSPLSPHQQGVTHISKAWPTSIQVPLIQVPPEVRVTNALLIPNQDRNQTGRNSGEKCHPENHGPVQRPPSQQADKGRLDKGRQRRKTS